MTVIITNIRKLCKAEPPQHYNTSLQGRGVTKFTHKASLGVTHTALKSYRIHRICLLCIDDYNQNKLFRIQ